MAERIEFPTVGDIVIELLIKDPSYTQTVTCPRCNGLPYKEDEEGAIVCPTCEGAGKIDAHHISADSAEWSKVPLVVHTELCGHLETVCPECADSWRTDYWMRISVNDQLVWISPDYPGGTD